VAVVLVFVCLVAPPLLSPPSHPIPNPNLPRKPPPLPPLQAMHSERILIFEPETSKLRKVALRCCDGLGGKGEGLAPSACLCSVLCVRSRPAVLLPACVTSSWAERYTSRGWSMIVMYRGRCLHI
jgi:hypothetical protein